MNPPTSAAETDPSPHPVAGQLEKIILARIARDQLVLPSQKAVARRCLSALHGPEEPLAAAAAIIEQDPLLAVLVMRAARGKGEGEGIPVTVGQAVTLLGERRLMALLKEAATTPVAGAHDIEIAGAAAALWTHARA